MNQEQGKMMGIGFLSIMNQEQIKKFSSWIMNHAPILKSSLLIMNREQVGKTAVKNIYYIKGFVSNDN